MDILRGALGLLPPVRRVRRFREDPAGVQRRALRSLLTRAAGTEWGRRHGFAEIALSPEPEAVYRERAPLGTSDRLKPFIERMRAGEPDVLWPGRVTTFVRSTGTTGTPKLLPCTDDTLRQWVAYSASVVLCHALASRDLRCLGGRRLSMAGVVREEPGPPPARVGDISALASDWWSARDPRRWFVPDRDLPRRIRAIANLDEQVDAACDFAMDLDVRMVSIAPSWALMLFERLIERFNARQRPAPTAPTARPGRPERVTTVGEIWPGLRLVICGGVPLSTYREPLLRRIGLPDVTLLETYGSSETLVAFQERPDAAGMLLDLGLGTYFEFVRAADAHEPDPRRFSVAEVEAGATYVPVVSTPSGLWASPLGDLVRFTSVFPHELVIEGRTTEIVDSWGEKVTGDQARRALDAACAATGIVAPAFHVVPRPASGSARHAHRWLIEIDAPSPPPPSLAATLARLLDESLSALSPTYAQCRADFGLGAPEVVTLHPGALRRALERVRGPVGVQGKVPRASDRTEIADAVVAGDRVG